MAKRGLALGPCDEADLRAFHARVLDNLELAASTFMTEDLRAAQSLLDAKRQLNAMERAAGRRHLGLLGMGGLEISTLYLAIVRDLRRVNSHVSAVAYDVLDLVDPHENQENAAEITEEAVQPSSSLPSEAAISERE